MTTPDTLRSDLVSSISEAERLAAENRRILAASRERLETVQARLKEIRSQALRDAPTGDEYMRLTAERGRLDLVLADQG